MGYQALYRTYRPLTFSEVVGQEVVVKTLQNSLTTGKISHAYLFSGPRGTGKTSIARIYAKALNCESAPTSEPCGKCRSCREIAESMSPDVIEIDAASNNGVDEIRDIREKVKFLPAGAKYKIYIIDEVHMLSSGAFNALLKTLEEPPKHVVFILATTEPHKVLPTILSRCQRYDFKAITVKEIAERLREVVEKEGIEISEEAITGIAESAEGGMRDALSYLDQAASFSAGQITVEDVNHVTGNLGYDKMIAIVKYIQEKNIEQALKTITEILDLGKEINKLVGGLLQFYRDVLLYKNMDTSNYSKYIFGKEEFKVLANLLQYDRIFYYVDVLSDVQTKIKFSNTPHIFLEVAMIKMINTSNEDLDFVKRLKELEEKIEQINIVPNVMSGDVPVDNEKINIVDAKLNKVIAELNRLELHKLQEKVWELDAKNVTATNNIEEDSVLKFNEFMQQIKQELEVMKVEVSSLKNSPSSSILYQNEMENINSNQYEKLEHLILKLEKEIAILKESVASFGNQNIVFEEKNQQESLVKSIVFFEEKILVLKEEMVNLIHKEINEWKNNITTKLKELNDKKTVTNGPVDEHIIKEICEKIEYIEEKLYRLISGTLIDEQPVIKKTKRKTILAEGQVMFSGGEITTISELKNQKERVDFGDIQKSKEEMERAEFERKMKHLQEQENEKTQVETKNTVVVEVPIVDHVIEVRQDKPKVEQVSELSFEKPIPQKRIDIAEASLSSELEKQREKRIEKAKELDSEILELMGKSKEKSLNEEKKSRNEVIHVLDLEDQTIIEKTNSSIVTKKTSKDGIFALSTDDIKNELLNEKKSFEETRMQQESHNSQVDEYSLFSVQVLERILNDSRTDEAKNDKARITNLWKIMHHNVHLEDTAIVKTLQEGIIAAVGNKEFILIFKSHVLCNQVMSYKFKRRVLKILYDLLGDTYNFMALPDSVWLEKRAEYINQYTIGVRHPKLTPINDPNLYVLTEEEDQEVINQKDKMIASAYEMFGKDIIKIE